MSDFYWGYHLIVNGSGFDHEAITTKKTIEDFARDLVAKIDMVAYGEPQVVHFGEGNKEGYTLVQLIETSNIVAHFNNIDDTGYLDIFSCKPFDELTAVSVIQQWFGEDAVMETAFLLRKAP